MKILWQPICPVAKRRSACLPPGVSVSRRYMCSIVVLSHVPCSFLSKAACDAVQIDIRASEYNEKILKEGAM